MESNDYITVTLRRYEVPDTARWPITKLLGKWRKSPLAIRKLGTGRYAVDTYNGVSIILEIWFIRNK